jgi:hypothetical protein
VARYLVLWRRSPTAWPTDPVEYSNLIMRFKAAIDNSMKKGEMKEHGHFLDGTSGYTIWEVEATDLLRNYSMLVPYYECEVHEIIPYEKSREILTAVFEARTEAAKK